MTRFTILLAALLAALGAFGEQARSPRSTIHITFTSPESFDRLWDDAHLVVRVRVLESHAELKVGPKQLRHVFTVHRVQVEEVYRAQVPEACFAMTAPRQCVPSVGDRLVVYQDAGEVVTAEGETLQVADEKPLTVGAEHFLFLVWHSPLNGFVSRYGSYGAFEVRQDVVHATSRAGRSEHEGKTAKAFAQELRAMRAKEKTR